MAIELSVRTEAQAASVLGLKNLPTPLNLNRNISRHRSLSISSSSTTESTSSVSQGSTTLSIKDDEVKRIFQSLKNVHSGTDTSPDLPTPTFRLAFPCLPYVNAEDSIWQHRNPGSLLLEDSLNPDAAPFVPRSASYETQLFPATLSIHTPSGRRVPHHIPDGFAPPRGPNDSIYHGMLQIYDEPSCDCLQTSNRKAQIIATSYDNNPAVPPGLGLLPKNTKNRDPELTPRPWIGQASEQSITPAPPRFAPWLTPFTYGINPAMEPAIRELNAQAVISSIMGPWADEDFIELAAHFSWRAYGDTEDTGDTLAAFAEAIFRSFEAMLGPEPAQSFLWNLREAVFGNFITSWDPIALDGLSSDFDPLALHVISAISVARFIGDLFQYNLATKAHVATCISKIFENMVSEEHVVTIGQLVVHSGPGLWACSPQVNGHITDFLNKFVKLAGGIQMSMLGREAGYARGWVDLVVEDLKEWEACLMGSCVVPEHGHAYAAGVPSDVLQFQPQA